MNTGAKLVILSCVLAHCFIFTTNNWIKDTMTERNELRWNITQGFGLLLYPIYGWIADVYVPRFKMIKASFILVLLCSLITSICASIGIFIQHLPANLGSTFQKVWWIINVVLLVIGVGGIGIYEANAIQFGLQQLFEASSEELSSFIHWYYWGLQIGQLIAFYVTLPVIMYFINCRIMFDGYFPHEENIRNFAFLIFAPSFLQLICSIVGVYIFSKGKHYLEVHQTKINPFKSIFKVLQYSFKHKYPQRRSALTYWEPKIPSRIDLGKLKYGGPFTNEEVEDTKTFFRLLILILSLFGFFIKSEQQTSLPPLFHKIGCPGLTTLTILIMNSDHLQLLIISIGIPIYELVLKKYLEYHIPNLLTRIGMGLFLCLVEESINVLLLFFAKPEPQGPILCEMKTQSLYVADSSSQVTFCLLANTKFINSNGTCSYTCPGVINNSYLFYLQALPMAIRAFSLILVSMTVLEFLCAQAPHRVKGLLIGIWYSLLSIQFVGINTIKTSLIAADSTNQWIIYCGIKGFSIFISLLLYSKVSKGYCYRERDEVINEQAMIEEVYERELLLEDSRYESEEEIAVNE